MRDLKPNTGLNLQLLKPASYISFSHSFFSLSFPLKRVSIQVIAQLQLRQISIITCFINYYVYHYHLSLLPSPRNSFFAVRQYLYAEFIILIQSCRTHCKIINSTFINNGIHLVYDFNSQALNEFHISHPIYLLQDYNIWLYVTIV